MRVVVTGREGQVASALAERARDDIEIVRLGRPELDLAGPPDAIVSAIGQARPELIVSAAAYTQVDKAETEPDVAFAINERGARAVARAASELGVAIVHLSTDYVFDGLKSAPYAEADSTRPTGVYGASKLAGEHAVLEENADSVVLRTAWVYSPFGSNFVKTMLRLGADRDEVAVVADQRGNPTNALDIADGIIAVARNLAASDDPELRGVFHMAGSGEASWAELAEATFAVSAARGGPSATVRRIDTAEYPTAARRPENSRLDCGKLARVHGITLPDWHNVLERVVSRLLQPADSGGMT
ncbi:MAG TPA: dTDP-4-dehydrorhamnose reductase [Sphingomicrobium sp.]|jgi:dTDP-4-dehydrorhamnose reductase|nr:dTDP-4-dehydrorhamnose reductase [Sphingomicrobium sp.]